MKQARLFSLLGLLSFMLVSGCTEQQQRDQLLSPKSETALHIASMDGEGQLTADMDAPLREPMSMTQDRNQGDVIGKVNGSSCTADFVTAGGSEYDFGAVLNRAGIHGDWTIHHRTFGLITGETLCLSNNANIAMVAFLVTSIESPTATFDVNDIVYLKLKDNGEGSNSDSDQTSSFFVIFYNWDVVVDGGGNIQYETPEAFIADYPCSEIEQILQRPLFGSFVNIADGNIQVRN